MRILPKTRNKSEQGIVSIMVTMILLLVISLIVISFARTSRREERDSLDRQLSTNAFYAAESGINAARNAIASTPALLDSSFNTGCSDFANATTGLPNQVTVPSANIGSPTSNATYTCLFVDPYVSSIEHTKTSEPYSFPLKPAGNYAFGTLDFYWDAGVVGTYTNCPPQGSNPASWPASTCGSGILRLELTDTTNLGVNKVYFIYPSGINGPGANINSNDPTGQTYSASCSSGGSPKQCHFSLVDGNNNHIYYARVSSLYAEYALTVKPNSSNKEFAGAQVMIDATGKAADVQRRMQIRYSISDLGGPQFAIQSGASTCKKFSIDGTRVYDGPNPNCWGGAIYPNGSTTVLP